MSERPDIPSARAALDLVLAREPAELGAGQQAQLVRAVAGYAGIQIGEVRVLAVAPPKP